MEIRSISVDDLPEYRHIASRAFSRGEPVAMEPERLLDPGRTRLGLFEHGRLQAQYSIIDQELFFGTARRPCGGIASVACEPSARGRGYAGALINHSLELMRERGLFLSLLWPFDQRFYQKYGWDGVGHTLSHSAPLDLLENSPEADHIEPVYSEYHSALNPVYEEAAVRYNGAMARDAARWDHLLKPRNNREAASYVYRRDGRAEGIAVIRYDVDKDLARADEFVALTSDAYRAFLTLFKRHAATVKRFEWQAPMDDILWSLATHWDIKTRVCPSAMGRIVDVKAALEAIVPPIGAQGETTVRVVDTHAPWNDGVWRAAVDGSSTLVERSMRTPQITLDIRTLTQAYWGSPSLGDSRRAGRVEVGSEVEFHVLTALLPASPVWLTDDF